MPAEPLWVPAARRDGGWPTVAGGKGSKVAGFFNTPSQWIPDSWRKNTVTHHRFGRRQGAAAIAGDGEAKIGQFFQANTAVAGMAPPQGRGHLFQGGVAGPFPQAVDGDAQGPGSGRGRTDGIGRGHTQVVVGMELDVGAGNGRARAC